MYKGQMILPKKIALYTPYITKMEKSLFTHASNMCGHVEMRVSLLK